MSKAAKIPLPSNLAPDIFKCLPFNVPDDQEYIGMFFGALYQLTVWSSYDIDGTLAGKTVADVWKGVIDDARHSECVQCPGAYAIKDVTYCPQDPNLFDIRQMSTGDFCDSNERVYFSHSLFDNGAAKARVGYQFFDFVTDDPCATTVYEVRGFMFSPIFLNHNWTLQWRDEFNVDHEVDQDDVEFSWTTSFTAQKLCLTADHDFAAVITINKPKIAL